MKRNLALSFVFLFALLLFSACSEGEKTTGTTIIYGITFLISLILAFGYLIRGKKKELWFSVLFVSVAVVNFGYLLLSISDTLTLALWANRISYLGSVFLPMSMLFIILKVIKVDCSKSVVVSLLSVGILVFLIAASPGVLDIYYKEVSLIQVNGVSVLKKVYGPLHRIYMVYLLGYFGSMVFFISNAMSKKKIDSPVHSIVLLSAVFVNIGVWLIEQFVKVDFEVLSISYIISELFLLGIHLLTEENEKRMALAKNVSKNEKIEDDYIVPEKVYARFEKDLLSLTPTEKTIYELYIDGKGTKDVLQELCITENTLKFHNKNIYSKLHVSSRKELLQIAKSMNKAPQEV